MSNIEDRLIVKFNGGAGAVLCSSCRVIMKTLKDCTEEERKYFIGEIKHLPPQYCEKCSDNGTISTKNQ